MKHVSVRWGLGHSWEVACMHSLQACQMEKIECSGLKGKLFPPVLPCDSRDLQSADVIRRFTTSSPSTPVSIARAMTKVSSLRLILIKNPYLTSLPRCVNNQGSQNIRHFNRVPCPFSYPLARCWGQRGERASSVPCPSHTPLLTLL